MLRVRVWRPCQPLRPDKSLVHCVLYASVAILFGCNRTAGASKLSRARTRVLRARRRSDAVFMRPWNSCRPLRAGGRQIAHRHNVLDLCASMWPATPLPWLQSPARPPRSVRRARAPCGPPASMASRASCAASSAALPSKSFPVRRFRAPDTAMPRHNLP